MADAAARREARQRKIAENAEDRMRRIMRLADKRNDVPTTHTTFPFAETANQTQEELPLGDSGEYRHSKDVPAGDEYSEFGMKMAPPQQKGLIYRKLILLLLGISVRYMNLVFENGMDIVGVDLNYLHLDAIFMPFLLYEVTEYFLCPPTPEVNMTLNLLMKVNNIRGRGVDFLVDLLNHVLRSLKDMGVYFFAFVFLDMVFAIFNVDDDVV